MEKRGWEGYWRAEKDFTGSEHWAPCKFFLGHSFTKGIHNGFSLTFVCSKAGQGPFSETRGLKFEWSIHSFYPHNQRIIINRLNRLLYILA